MNTKQKIALVTGGILALVSGFAAGPQIITGVQMLLYNHQSTVAEASWSDAGTTVAEMVQKADLIVRASVVKSDIRELRSTLPTYAEDAKTVIGEKEFVTLFTDSQMQVLEVYKGSAEESITVMQTGAFAENADANVTAFSINGDPIFVYGSEHILFLVDITNDGVNSTGRKLYRVVNPFGRYELRNGSLITPADVMAIDVRAADTTAASDLPTSPEELVAEIRQSVKN